MAQVLGSEDLEIPGTKPPVAAVCYGSPADRPILALHGWLDNAASFERLAPLLPGNRIVAVDWPGHGLSAHRGDGGYYHFIDWVADVQRIAAGLGWARFTIVAHSMGAGAAMLAAAAMPKQVAAVVLIEALMPQTATPQEGPARLRTFLKALGSRRPAPVYKDEQEALAARLTAGKFARPERLLPIVRRALMPVAGGLTWRSDWRLKLPSPYRMDREQVSEFLRQVTCPTLLIEGADGLLVKSNELAADVEQLAGLLPGLQRRMLPGFHHLHLDEPEAVAEVIREFLARAAP